MQETKSLRQFGFIMAFCFGVLGIAIPLYKVKVINPLFTALALLFLILALVAPGRLKKFREWWMLLGEILGTINSKILFTLFFFTIFTSIHYIFRLLKRDRFKRKWKAYDSTYVQKLKLSNFSDPF